MLHPHIIDLGDLVIIDYDLGFLDDEADTLRFPAVSDEPPDPDGTAIYDLGDLAPVPRYVGRSPEMAQKRLIRTTRQSIASLRDAMRDGWDVGPELAHEQRRLSLLEGQV